MLTPIQAALRGSDKKVLSIIGNRVERILKLYITIEEELEKLKLLGSVTLNDVYVELSELDRVVYEFICWRLPQIGSPICDEMRHLYPELDILDARIATGLGPWMERAVSFDDYFERGDQKKLIFKSNIVEQLPGHSSATRQFVANRLRAMMSFYQTDYEGGGHCRG